MKPLRLYLLHGFLGLPKDWDPVVSLLKDEFAFRGFDLLVDKRDLWQDLERIQNSFFKMKSEKIIESGEKPSAPISICAFEKWVDQFVLEVKEHSEPKVFLGYSFGGRLLMHMPWQRVKNLQMVGYLGSHPGLFGRQEKELRKQNEQAWSLKFQQQSWDEVIKSWNQQEVFSQDKNRPVRAEKNYKLSLIKFYFENWTLSSQKAQDDNLKKCFQNQYWFYGEKDQKYQALTPRMESLLGQNHCRVVEGAGHGLLWSPEPLAKSLLHCWDKSLKQTLKQEKSL